MEEIKLNLPPFYPSQQVVYITGVNLPKDSVWTVLAVDKSPCCGLWRIDIGLKHDSYGSRFECMNCNAEYHTSKPVNTKWFLAKSFRPIEHRFISLAEVIEKESLITCVN